MPLSLGWPFFFASPSFQVEPLKRSPFKDVVLSVRLLHVQSHLKVRNSNFINVHPFNLISSASSSHLELLHRLQRRDPRPIPTLRSDTPLPLLEFPPLDLPASNGQAATRRLIVLSVLVFMLFIETKLFQYQVLRSLYL